MFFYVDPHSTIPIYVQISNQIKHAIASELLKPGDKLPSVRKLANEIVINPNTVARAYTELERENILETIKGRGTFVAKSQSALIYSERLKQLRRIIDRLLVEAYHLNVAIPDVRDLLEEGIARFNERGEE